MDFFSTLPTGDDILSAGRAKITNALGNNGLLLRKGIGTAANIANQVQTILSFGPASQDANTGNPQREYLWVFVVPDMNSGLVNISGVDIAKYCLEVKFSPPEMKDVVNIKYGPFKRSYPGTITTGNVTATFICPIPDIVSQYFRIWQNLIIDSEGVYYPKINYAKTASVTLYSRTGLVNTQLNLRNVFPIKIGEYNLSYYNKQFVKYTVVMNCDGVEVVDTDMSP